MKSWVEFGYSLIQFAVEVQSSLDSGVVDTHREVAAVSLVVRAQPHVVTLHHSYLHAQNCGEEHF